MSEFRSTQQIRARKEHICFACENLIQRGEVYWRCAIYRNKEFFVCKTCDKCISSMRSNPNRKEFDVETEERRWLNNLHWANNTD